jgi:hypothetical protein
METLEAVRAIMKLRGVNITTLGRRIGVTQGVISQRMRQKAITTVKLNEMLRGLDYRIVLMPYNTRVKDGWYEIEE